MSYLGVGTVFRCEIMSHSSVGWNIVISQPAPTSLRWDIVTWDTGIRGMSSTDEKGTKLNKVRKNHFSIIGSQWSVIEYLLSIHLNVTQIII